MSSQPFALHNLEAEMSTLGSMLLKEQAIDVVTGILTAEDFFYPAHRELFASIERLNNAGKAVELLTVKNDLLARGKLSEVGGEDYLIQVAESTPSAANAEHYAKIVREKAVRRAIDSAGHDMRKDAGDGEIETADLVDKSEEKVFAIGRRGLRNDMQPMATIARRGMERLDRLIETGQPEKSMETGFYDLDRLTLGLRPGSLTILAARPSMGKTSLYLKMAVNISRYHGPVAFFSAEMNADDIGDRAVSMLSGVSSNALRRPDMNTEAYRRLADAYEILYTLPFAVDDSSAPTVMEMRGKARRQKREQGLSMIGVDYLGLIRHVGKKSSTRSDDLSAVTKELKALAKDLDVPVIALSQLNRNAENRENKRPQLADLRDSGAIEEDADYVLFLYRDDYYKARENPEEANTDPERIEVAELIVSKNRYGPIGTVKLAFQPTYANFENLRI